MGYRNKQNRKEEGLKAKLAIEAGALTEAVERVVEANTLLSGLGFESAGLSAAHAIHNAMSVLEETKDCMHGEKVSFGVMVQLVLENVDEEELEEVLELLLALGLPVCLEALGVTDPDEKRLRKLAEGAADPEETAKNMCFMWTRRKSITRFLRPTASDGTRRRSGNKRIEAGRGTLRFFSASTPNRKIPGGKRAGVSGMIEERRKGEA